MARPRNDTARSRVSAGSREEEPARLPSDPSSSLPVGPPAHWPRDVRRIAGSRPPGAIWLAPLEPVTDCEHADLGSQTTLRNRQRSHDPALAGQGTADQR